MTRRPIPIDDPLDPRLEPYRDVKDRDLAGRGGRFMAEGEVVLRLLVQRGRFPLESLLVSEKRLAGLADVIAALPPDLPVYTAPQAVLDNVAGFPLHRGILGLGSRGQPMEADALLAGLPERALVVALVGLANHDNVGGIFRNAAAFGAAAVLLDTTSCDPLYRKAIRVSVGSTLVVPFARAGSGEAMIERLGRHGFEVLSLSPSGRETLAALTPPPRAALLLGTEGPGLPAEILARTRSVRIPMAPGLDSLNVATSSGIALHHLAALG